MAHLESPAWLSLFAVVLLLSASYVVVQVRRKIFAARFTNLALLASVAPRRPGWRRHFTFGLLLAALALMSVGLAEPTALGRIPSDRATVMLAIDVSPSMVATDVLPTRLKASQAGATLFAKLLPPRVHLGLVKFGGAANVVVPPTLDRTEIATAIAHLQLIRSTAIGEAVFACLDAIATFGRQNVAVGDSPPPARIVLMSDGSNNTGRPIAAAIAAARAVHVPVFTIAFGTDTGTVAIDGHSIPVPADKQALSTLAQRTGGSFHTAASAEELRSAYSNIESNVGYVFRRHLTSWRFFAVAALLASAAAATSVLWGGRLL